MIENHNAWDDPNVKSALKQRGADHVYLICCFECGNYGYYNEGSHVSCQWCEWSVSGDELDSIIDNGEVITLSDYTDMQVQSEDLP